VILPSDLAPIENGARFQSPGAQTDHSARCSLDVDDPAHAQPQFFAVEQPYLTLPITPTAGASLELTITGEAFGTTPGTVLANNTIIPTSSWTDRQIVAQFPETTPAGVYQLEIVSANGLRTANGISLHLLGEGYNPRIFEVGVGKEF